MPLAKEKKKQYKLKKLIRNILIITALSTNYLKICSQEYAYTNSQTKDDCLVQRFITQFRIHKGIFGLLQIMELAVLMDTNL
jgi:hypothetical protein